MRPAPSTTILHSSSIISVFRTCGLLGLIIYLSLFALRLDRTNLMVVQGVSVLHGKQEKCALQFHAFGRAKFMVKLCKTLYLYYDRSRWHPDS
jgi:hypothetical protein